MSYELPSTMYNYVSYYRKLSVRSKPLSSSVFRVILFSSTDLFGYLFSESAVLFSSTDLFGYLFSQSVDLYGSTFLAWGEHPYPKVGRVPPPGILTQYFQNEHGILCE